MEGFDRDTRHPLIKKRAAHRQTSSHTCSILWNIWTVNLAHKRRCFDVWTCFASLNLFKMSDKLSCQLEPRRRRRSSWWSTRQGLWSKDARHRRRLQRAGPRLLPHRLRGSRRCPSSGSHPAQTPWSYPGTTHWIRWERSCQPAPPKNISSSNARQFCSHRWPSPGLRPLATWTWRHRMINPICITQKM